MEFACCTETSTKIVAEKEGENTKPGYLKQESRKWMNILS